MTLSRYQFEVLAFLEREGEGEYGVRRLADELRLSGTCITRTLDGLAADGFVRREGELLAITDAGIGALEPYRVRRAVILGAGFGSRMMPATADRPKPMVTVRGTRIIDTLLDALLSVGITDITFVGGYRFERLAELREKYPFLRLVENARYAEGNNILSMLLALDKLHGGCYLCEADLFITNPGVIRKYQYASNILGSFSLETDDWSFKMEDGCLEDYRKGGTFRYNYYGISYWTAEDGEKLIRDFPEAASRPDGTDLFWEFVPFVIFHDRYRVEVRPCEKADIMEIDNYRELAQLDPVYALPAAGEGGEVAK